MNCREIRFTKYHLTGELEGQTTEEDKFCKTFDQASEWAGKKTMDLTCSFVVLKIEDLESGAISRF